MTRQSTWYSTQLYLYVARYGAGDEKLLVGVDGDALDGLLVRAEKMDLLALAEVPHSNLQERGREGEEASTSRRLFLARLRVAVN